MKFIVPEILVPAIDEKTLRQYKCAYAAADQGGLQGNLFICVTNRRIIQYAAEGLGKKASVLHNEIYLSDVSGLSLYRGKTFNQHKARSITIWCLCIAVLAAAALLVFNGLNSLFGLEPDWINYVICGVAPFVVMILLMMLLRIGCYTYPMNIVVMTRGMTPGIIDLDGRLTDNMPKYIALAPYLEETEKMFAELSSIILDVQRFGHLEVLKYIDAEQDIEQPEGKAKTRTRGK